MLAVWAAETDRGEGRGDPRGLLTRERDRQSMYALDILPPVTRMVFPIVRCGRRPMARIHRQTLTADNRTPIRSCSAITSGAS